MSLIILLLSKTILIGGYKVSYMIILLLSKVYLVFLKEQLMMLNVLLSIFIWFKLILNKFLMCKKICLLTMPNRIYRPSGLKPEEELALKILSIQRDIRRGSSKILKCRKNKLLVLQRRRRSTKKLINPMIQLQVKSLLLIQIVYLPSML